MLHDFYIENPTIQILVMKTDSSWHHAQRFFLGGLCQVRIISVRDDSQAFMVGFSVTILVSLSGIIKPCAF